MVVGILVKRNLRQYFRDSVAVFFSLLAVLIVVGLYIAFLAKLQIDSVVGQTGGKIEEKLISYLINTWILAGLLSVTSLTSTLGALGTMVDDREKHKLMDFKSSPINESAYPLAMVISAVCVGTLISIFAMSVYIIYIGMSTGCWLSMMIITKTIALILLSSFSNAALMSFFVSFLSTAGAYSSLSLIVGTLIGFFNGLYVPMVALPDTVKTIIGSLPFGQTASAFRQIMLEDALAKVFSGALPGMREAYEVDFGIVLQPTGKTVEISTSLIYIAIVAIVSIILFFINYNRKKSSI